jgi:ABC-type lipoprotein release transport system permease subunit
MGRINLYFFEFALAQLFKNKTKSLFIVLILFLLVFTLGAVFQVSYSISKQLSQTIKTLPDIIVQDNYGGFHRFIESKTLNNLLQINGVKSGSVRVWGHYQLNGTNLTILGIDPFEKNHKPLLETIGLEASLFNNSNSIVIDTDTRKIFNQNYYDTNFSFMLKNGKKIKTQVVKVINSQLLTSTHLILMNKNLARKILNIKDTQATDIALKISNYDELEMIKYKIESLLPFAKVVSKDEIKRDYNNMMNYKGGVFLALFIVVLLTYFIILYDKVSAVNSSEKKEIAILKAMGWSTNNILKVKFYEGMIISIVSYTVGVIFAFIYVYFFDALYLKDIFVGYSNLKSTFPLDFMIDFEMLLLVFLLTVPIYAAASIFPSWKIAVSDVDEVLR